jgi:DNA (cytosine-5)-methyltransferase 1
MTRRPPEARVYLDEIIVDSFAGGGGASKGIEMALGRSPDIAINHDAEAIALHKANHPDSKHYTENVWSVDPLEATGGRPVGLMWLSPDCKHFSKAKGGKPVSKKIRGLAWVAIRWAASVRPRIIVLENVEEFQQWGPVLKSGVPCKRRKGQTFRAFVRKLERHGYQVEWREIRACDYGAPTIRKRLFLIARCDGQPIVWPKPTHGKGTPTPWRTAAECIQWEIMCPSIFDRKKALADNTLRRIARGIKKFVIDSPSPFIVSNMTNNWPRSVDEPLSTILTGNHKYLAQPFITGLGGRMSQTLERSTDQPMQTICAKADSAIVVPSLQTYYGHQDRVNAVDEPLRTQGTENRFGLLSPLLIPIDNQSSGDAGARSGDEPLTTITAEAGHAIIVPHITKFHEGSTGSDMNLPMPTVTSNGDNAARPGCAIPLGLVSPYLIPTAHQGDERAHSIEEPLRTICGGKRGDHAIVAPFLKPRYGEDPDPTRRGGLGQAPRVRSLEEPMPVIVPTGNGGDLVATYLAKHNGGHEATGQELAKPVDTICATDQKALVAVHVKRDFGQSVGSDANAPIGTITPGGQGKAALIASHLTKMYGTARHGQQLDLPMHTVTANDRGGGHIAEVRAFLISYYGVQQNPGDLNAPTPTIRSKDSLGLVTVEGVEYAIADIGMRMLAPRELYRAQGFPDTYRIDIEYKGKPMTKTAQVRMCGNSVCPPLAAAIVAANYVADNAGARVA